MGYKDDNYSSKVCNHHPETCTCRDWNINEKPKQETLEEVSKEYVNGKCSGGIMEKALLSAIEFGAKWQAERMYSEEEVMNMFHELSMHLPLHYEFLVREMFKKK